jgi:hypothetical protein
MKNSIYWAALIWILISVIPSPPSPGGVGIDASWIWGLNLANQAGLVFGRDIFFAYGPLGYLNVPMFPESSSTEVLLYLGLIYGVWVASVVRIGRSNRLLAMLLALSGVPLAIYYWDHFEISVMALAIAIVATNWRAAMPLLAMLAGAASLFRLYQGIQGAALLLLVLAWFRVKRDYVLMPLLAIATALGLWAYKGHPIEVIPQFLLAAIDIVGGYGEAMAAPGPMWQVLAAGGAVVAATAIAAWASPVAALPVFLLSFLAFKHGVVRQDAHMAPVHFKIAIVVLLAWAAASRRKDTAGRYFAGMTVANLVLGFAIGIPLFPYMMENCKQRLSGWYAYNFVQAFAAWPQTVRGLQAQRPAILASRLMDKRPGEGTIDVIPNNIDVIEANHLNYKPRPVIQSYQSYTPRLDAWNSQRLDANRLLIHWDPIDGRHPYFDEPLLWRQILGRYEYETTTNQGQLWRQSGGPALQPSLIGGPASVRMGEWMTVPAGERVALQAEVRPNLLGRAIAFVLRAIPVLVEVEFTDNGAATYRTVRANLVSGPIVNPFPVSLTETKTVRRVRFVTAAPGRYDPVIRVQWVGLTNP